jgi:phosphatidylserine/phosphatidylglycerophosphate/cardiolipin synthase-like enzyme
LKNLSRGLSLKFQDELEREIWWKEINRRIQNYKSNIKNKYDSFANQKDNCNAEFFVDAHDYFYHLHKNLMEAKESIYIAGWWVSPELFLCRPYGLKDKNVNNPVKLMDVLLHKAKQGIQINILIYKEFTVAMTLNSNHTKKTFENLHENIKVCSIFKQILKSLGKKFHYRFQGIQKETSIYTGLIMKKLS